MLKKILNLILLIILLNILNSCQFSSLFHRANKIQNPSANFNNLNSYSVNEENFSVTQDTLKSTLSIYKDTIKLNKTYEIKSMDFLSKSGNKLSGLLLSPKIKQLTENGFQVFTFDYSGYGFSDGKATRKNVLTDAYSALDFIKNNPIFKNKKVIIFGQSYGGHIASVVGSNRQNDIEGMIIEGAFYSHRKEAVYTAGFVANIVYDGIRAEKEIKKNKKPILIIHSKEDKRTPIKFGRKIFDEANEPKYFMEIDKNHLEGLQYYGDSIKVKINEIFR
jgi:predicted esterase